MTWDLKQQRRLRGMIVPFSILANEQLAKGSVYHTGVG